MNHHYNVSMFLQSDKMVAVTYRPWARESTMQNAQPVVSCYIPGCVLDFIRASSPTSESLDFRVATRTNKCGYNHLAIKLPTTDKFTYREFRNSF